MPKKGQSSRGAAPKKTPTAVPDVDDSFIVFTSDKGKTRHDNAASKKAGDVPKNAGEASSTTATDAPKRPDTRTLIGGASWTGKLPVNMLAEHCQKQKWAKCEYTMSHSAEGYSSMVILKTFDPKTRETVALPPFKLPPTHKHLALQPTAVEARHFAATYALFRINSMKNIHMMLPPTYRDLWKNDFQALKKDDVGQGRGYMYEADPFLARRERDEAQASLTKKRAQREADRAKEHTQTATLTNMADGTTHPSGGGGGQNLMKGWTRIPKVEMGKRTRTQIEALIRQHAVWNPYGISATPLEREDTVRNLSELGFRRSHVEEAVAQCKDRAEALEWLLIHVPEDDLPRWSLPEGYSAGISMVSGDLRREGVITRLAAAGFARELCERVVEQQGGDEGRAAEILQDLLVGEEAPVTAMGGLKGSEELAMWTEEQSTLEAIFADRYRAPSPDTCHILLTMPLPSPAVTLQVRRPAFKAYPHAVPIIAIQSTPVLPAYIRLSVIRQAIKHAMAHLRGEPMIFSLVDWLEGNMAKVMENPGSLRDVSAATETTEEVRASRRERVGRGKENRRLRPVDWRPGSQASLRMLQDWKTRQTTARQERMMSGRRGLPAWSLRDDIVDTVNAHHVTIISGETGSGKSTQSVQFILDDLIQRQLGGAANIICTQPRRISALGLADRVSDERCTPVGDEVGFIIRGESKQTPGRTKITFVTTGVLLRRLQTSGGSSDDVVAALADVSHVVVDEVHERSLDTDFLLVLLRDALRRRRDLKVILMSATLDADIFDQYFRGSGPVGRVEIQGRTFPVTDFYLDDVIQMTGFNQGHDGYARHAKSSREQEDDDLRGIDQSTAKIIQSLGGGIHYRLIAEIVREIDADLGQKEGGILIFLPGTVEISRTIDALRSMSHVHALPLHASLVPAEQRRVFQPAPKGMRKVIAATNIAETSITIEDIVAVIDTGRVKETSFDASNKMVKLEEVWASRAACKQRRGRAGRVRAGECYKLYTRAAETGKMRERPEPEIRRVPLEQLCLSVKAMGIADVPAFLASALTAPASLAVDGAMDLLHRIGALEGEELTALGRHLSMIPADLRCGKLLVYGATFGCLEACLVIASTLTVRSPFVAPQAKREESKQARVAFSQGQGDLLADLRAYEAWSAMQGTQPQREIRAWCEAHYLSYQTLVDISSNRGQFVSSLKEMGFLPVQYHGSDASWQASFNRHNGNEAILRALVAGAFHPQLVRIDFPPQKFAASVSGAVALDPEARTIKYFARDQGRVFVHPGSILFDAQTFGSSVAFLSYFTQMATSKLFIRDLTPFNAYTLLLFSGPITLDTLGRGLVVDGWVRLRGWARIGVLVSRLRTMLDDVLAKKIDDPTVDLCANDVVDTVRRLIELDGLDQ
ncbi:MAG: hypothetical protein M1838_002404 [Thelocarpon superellum]|nr:MAG: hypothetical protein M1838_002404 [Thelocarpon superellum]